MYRYICMYIYIFNYICNLGGTLSELFEKWLICSSLLLRDELNTCVFAFSKAILMLPCLMAFFTGPLAFCLFQLAIHSFI